MLSGSAVSCSSPVQPVSADTARAAPSHHDTTGRFTPVSLEPSGTWFDLLMRLVGSLGRLFVAQGVVGILVALVIHGGAEPRPAAVWVIGFLSMVLLSTGMVLWLSGDMDDTEEMRAAEERGRRRAAGDRSDWDDQ